LEARTHVISSINAVLTEIDQAQSVVRHMHVDLKQRKSIICEPDAMLGQVAAARAGGHYGGRLRPSAEAHQAVAH
jgi:hypothetical protein